VLREYKKCQRFLGWPSALYSLLEKAVAGCLAQKWLFPQCSVFGHYNVFLSDFRMELISSRPVTIGDDLKSACTEGNARAFADALQL
jgi:hypothetical protein